MDPSHLWASPGVRGWSLLLVPALSLYAEALMNPSHPSHRLLGDILYMLCK
jgi:hypothetical protein